jgi:hypothetical protein
MPIFGPDPDKNAFRFAIHRHLKRWQEIRPAWVEAADETSAQAIDAELARCADVKTLDDATHAKDVAELLDKHITRLEVILKSRQRPADMMARVRKNVEENRGKGLTLEDLQPVGWRYKPLHAKVSGKPGALQTISTGLRTRSARIGIDGFDGQIIAHWKTVQNDPIVKALADLPETMSPRLLEVELELTHDRGVLHAQAGAVELEAVEVTEASAAGHVPSFLHGMTVRGPAMSPGLDAEDEERVRQAQSVAAAYGGDVDDRNPLDVIREDLARGLVAAQAAPEDAPFARTLKETTRDRLAELKAGLQLVYGAFGIKVRSLSIVGANVHLVLENGRTITTPLDAMMHKLLEEDPPR